MEREKIVSEIRNILISTLGHDNFNISEDLSAEQVEGWDSLNHMTIITSIESKFQVKFKLKELNKLNNLGNLITLIASKL